jgi:PleD family two-component response regulator
MIFPRTNAMEMKASKQILIVDDEIFNIQAIKIILECNFDIQSIEQSCEIALNG